MKRILIVLLIVTLLLCGCDKKNSEEIEETQQRFTIEYREKSSSFDYFIIIRDTETGKAYLFVKSGYGGGLTLLEEDK